jgi:hypothetical protein
MMNIMIKSMNGDLTTVVLPEGSPLPFFKTILYGNVFTEAPYGCLVLRRILPELEEDDEATQLMVMGESLTDQDPHEVSYLCDGMVLSAMIDTALLYPSVDRWFHLDTGSHENSWIRTLDLVHDVDEDRWALRSSFVPQGHRFSKGQLLEYPVPGIRWYSHPTICLRNAPDRIPKDDTTLSSIQRIFDYEDWDSYGPDSDHENDEFDDENEPDQEWYEDNM